MSKAWYRSDLTVEERGRSLWFVAQTFAASAEEAIERIEKQLPKNWHVPMIPVGPILEPLKPNELGWQPKNGRNADNA